MAKKKARGAKGSEAERLVRDFLEWSGWTVHRAAATGMVSTGPGKWFVRSHDIFGCIDLVAFRRGGFPNEVWFLQVTTQAGKTKRRRKLEPLPWPDSVRVSLVSHEAVPDPANRARRKNYLKVEDLKAVDGECGLGFTWFAPLALEFDRKVVEDWAKAKRADEKAKKAEAK